MRKICSENRDHFSLGLDGIFDFMFSPEDHDIPESISLDDIRKYPSSHYEFRYTKQQHTPRRSFKPDVIVLQKIIRFSSAFILRIGMDDKERESIIEIWKTSVEVQQHFNDIEMKIRGLFITIVVAIGAAQGFLIEKKLSFALGPVTILYATFLPLLGVVAAYLFYFMDRYWYHRLLMGAVLHAGAIEEKYKNDLPLGLGIMISEQSPVELKGRFARAVAYLVVSDDTYRKEKKLHSNAKIELFYKSIVLLFFLWFAFTVLFVSVFVGKDSLIEFLVLQARAIVCPGT
jgi:hypothetical protein